MKKKPEVVRLSLFSPPAEKPTRQKRAVVPKDVGPKAKGKLPYYKENPPKYAYARHETPVPPGAQRIPPQYGEPQYNAPAQTPAQPPSSGSNMGIWITGVIIFFVIIFVLLTMDDGGGGFSSCQTTCDGYSISVAPGCDCPSGSRYYNTITNGPCIGCKQCICG